MLLCGVAVVQAAEIRLRTECRCDGPLVTLGDVAEVFAADRHQAEALTAVELFPTPSASRQRCVSLREIQDLLLLRGVNLADHRLSGSSQVTVLRQGRSADPQPERPVSPAATCKAHTQLREAIVRHLNENALGEDPWIVEMNLEPAHARTLAGANRKISITGGRPPWTGTQRFQVTIDTLDGPVRFSLDAQVSLPPAAVVAVRSLPRGALMRAGDVELRREVLSDASSREFYCIEDVLGKETTQAIAKGIVLEPKHIRSPLLVRRGEAVTVYARSAGIRVRTTGRARDNGSLDDLIPVESLANRQTFFARVAGLREVEVYARSAKADQTSASAKAGQASADQETGTPSTADRPLGDSLQQAGRGSVPASARRQPTVN
ncbi:MAG: flagella basal body P-ring formation protein FlgA [Planctomycetes bacterium RBG_13_63_9]|nr:MAG: flagella basal body P-ring formation protein FlgA [Planctomycetes bacterium RBG_13_63_9]